MKQATFDMLYAAADFILANSTENERTTIFKEMENGRKSKNLSDNNRILYVDKKFAKKIFKKIRKTL